MIGNAANNILEGLEGNDNITDDQGNDTLKGGAGDDFLYGGIGSNTLIGGDGNDVLDDWNGGLGSSTLRGGIGNDLYYIDNAISDKVFEDQNSGTDTVTTSVTYTLQSNFENLILSQNNGIRGVGNSLNNRIISEVSNVVLKGGAGNDTLIGSEFEGNDTLVGGLGNDTLTGGVAGENKDRFVFDSGAVFNKLTFGVDTITDFVSGVDKIILDKTSFTALNTFSFASVSTIEQAKTSSARIVYIRASGSCFYNSNGSASGFGTGGQFADVTDGLLLRASDFLTQA
nr:hypothetical protein [Leptolyngbya sp. FACHB-16]